MKPAWLKLIEQWNALNRFGLTIPFLIGALRRFPGQPLGRNASGMDDLLILLTSVRDDAPAGVTTRLYTCGTLQDLALAKVHGPTVYCDAVPSPTRPEPALYVEKGTITIKGDLLLELGRVLWERYGTDIEAGRFSRRAGAYHPFSESDVELIRAAISRSDDDDDDW